MKKNVFVHKTPGKNQSVFATEITLFSMAFGGRQ
jgi:hypothetical protein